MSESDYKPQYKIQMYGTEKAYLNGWFTVEEMQSILATMENMRKAAQDQNLQSSRTTE